MRYKKNKRMRYLGYTMLVISVIFIPPIFVNFLLLSWRSSVTFGESNSWMGLLGNYSGGIVGALVALIIVSTEIKFQKNQNKIIGYTNELPILKGLSFELEKIVLQLDIFKAHAKERPELLPQIKTDKLYITRWNNIGLITDLKLQEDLMLFIEHYEQFLDVISYDLDYLNLNIKRMKIDHQILERKKIFRETSVCENLELEFLNKEILDLGFEKEKYESLKRKFWKIEDRTLERAIDCRKRVELLIQNINNYIEN